MGKKVNSVLWELMNSIDHELFPIEGIADYIGELCMKAGDEKPYRVTELTYEQLFNIAGSLETSIKNIKRVMKEHIKDQKKPQS